MADRAGRHILACMDQPRVAALAVPGPPLASALDAAEFGEETASSGRVFPPRRITSMALIVTVEGDAEAEVEGVRLRHRRGSLLVVAPPFSLLERVDPRQPWLARWLLAEGPWLAPLADALAVRPGRLLLCERTPRRWLALAHRLIDLGLDQADGWAWEAAAVLAELLGALVHAAGPDEQGRSLADRVSALVDRNPERLWPLEGLARALGMSRSALAHRFTHEAGESVAAFIRRRRCEHARRLLATGLGVGVVAERLGFANPYHFSRCYRHVVGRPPSAETGGRSRLRP
jgi:AraC-like DNA-binding protein